MASDPSELGDEAAGEELDGCQVADGQRGCGYLRLAFFDVYIFVAASEGEELVVNVRHGEGVDAWRMGGMDERRGEQMRRAVEGREEDRGTGWTGLESTRKRRFVWPWPGRSDALGRVRASVAYSPGPSLTSPCWSG